MRICLINPSYAKFRNEGEEYSYSGFTLPHLGLGYIASYLEKAGFSVDVFECMGQDISMNELYKILVDNKYDMIGISIYEGNKKNGFKIINYLVKNENKGFVFIGGYTATLSSEQILRAYPSINCCVLGEGERTILELANRLLNNQEYKTIRGIAYIDGDRYIKNEKQDLIQDLDELPFPKRVFMNENKMISMVTSRGCNGNCIYCSIISLYRNCKGQIFRNRSAQNIVDEIEYLVNKYNGIKNICFFDDNFFENTLSNNKKVQEMILQFKVKKMYIPFSVTACARDVIRMKEILTDLKSIGLYKIFIGVESFVQRQLDFYNKNTTVEENIEAIKIINEVGIELSLGLIAFDPDVNLDEVELNFSSLKKMNLKNAGLTPFSLHTYLVAVRGTAFMNSLKKDNKYIPNERGYNFKYEVIENIIKYIDAWNKSTAPLVAKSYLIEVAQDKTDFQRVEMLKRIYNQFIELDIDYVIALCRAEKYGITLMDTYNTHLIVYHEIYEEFKAALQDY